jgi:NDP-sugar pyrophosphorylase family protein/mannose-6-phosphate isomerase-like protein (cupin superfamily)
MKLSEATTIYKAWGKEILLNHPEKDINNRYAYKRIYLNAGCRTSLQKHEYKSETNYIISGQAKVLIENENGELIETIMGPDEFFSIKPNQIHRVSAITDIILQECSTPEIRDCIRLSDDYNRKDGRIEEEFFNPVVLILASGKGERVKSISKNLHKGLLKVNHKAAISHIIDSFPAEFEFVVSLGYNGDILKSYLETAHPDRKITYVTVKDWESDKSGPGVSAYECKDHLQRPFYFVTVDCLFNLKHVPLIDGDNWIGVSPTDLPEIYSTALLDNQNNVIEFVNKSKGGFGNAFIGLAYIRNYKVFWDYLKDEREIIAPFINNFDKVKAKEIEFNDIGTIDGYNNTIKQYKQEHKNNSEETYIVGNRFIKINSDPDINSNRYIRSQYIDSELIPNNISYNKYCLSYDLVLGKPVYEIDDAKIYKKLINFVFNNIKDSHFVNPISYETGQNFYRKKTDKRINQFLQNNKIDDELIINGQKIKNIINLPFDHIIKSIRCYSNFHGDLQPDNIIYDGENFKYIDWRSDFDGVTDRGDINYDLAKLYGGLSFNYREAKNLEVFHFYNEGNEFNYTVPQTEAMKNVLKYFESELKYYGFDVQLIKQITALIWLNMSPIHCFPMNYVLYCEGLKMLHENK